MRQLAFFLALALGLPAMCAPQAGMAGAQSRTVAQRETKPPPGDRPPRGPAPAVSVDAGAAFDGWYDEGRWVMLLVEVRNDGPGHQLTVASRQSGTVFETAVEMPSRSLKKVPLYILPTGENVEVVVTNAAGERITSKRLRLRMTRNEELVAILAEELGPANALPPLAGAAARIVQRVVRPDELPESSLALGSVDRLVVLDVDSSSLSETRAQALLEWVALGGQLVVIGGERTRENLSALPPKLRAAEVIGGEIVDDWSGLGEISEEKPPTSSAYLALLEPAGAAQRVVTRQDGHPLLVRRRVGEGEVVALAFDPTQVPLSGWAGNADLWSALEREPPTLNAPSVWQSPGPDLAQVAASVARAQDVELPSIAWSVAILGLYILLVGPLNYLSLRRIRRLDLAWVTIPVLTVLAAVALYGLGSYIHGREVVVRQVSAVRVVPDAGVAYVQSVVGVFSPISRDFEAEIGSGFAFDPGARGYSSPGNPSVYGALHSTQGSPGSLRGLHVDQWSARAFQVEAVVPWPSSPVGDVVADNRVCSGSISNPFGMTVRGAQFLVPGGWNWLGESQPGDTHEVAAVMDHGRTNGLEVSRLSANGEDDPIGGRLRASVLSAVFAPTALTPPEMMPLYVRSPWGTSWNYQPTRAAIQIPQGAFVFGWVEEAPLDVELESWTARGTTQTLVYAPVPIEESP